MITVKRARISDSKMLAVLIHELVTSIYKNIKSKDNLVLKINKPTSAITKKHLDYAKSFIKSKNYYCFMAFFNNEPAGYVLFNIDDAIFYDIEKYGFIYDLYVREKFRGKKIASLLMDFTKKFLKSKGCSYFILSVNSKNKNALGIYRKWGMIETNKELLMKL